MLLEHQRRHLCHSYKQRSYLYTIFIRFVQEHTFLIKIIESTLANYTINLLETDELIIYRHNFIQDAVKTKTK